MWRLLEVLLGGCVGEVVTVGELDGGAGQGEEALVRAPGGAGHLLPCAGEGGGGVFGEGDAGVGGPGAGGAEGAGVGGAFAGEDGDRAAAGALEQGGGGEAERSAADDGDVLRVGSVPARACGMARSPEPQERDQPEPPWP